MKHKNLSEDQLAGQRLMVGFTGIEFNEELQYDIETLKVGGLILFSRNIVGPDQVQALCEAAQACARRNGQPPLFIAIDQEGGVVARLKAPFTRFAGNPSMTSIEDAVAFARITARELGQIGVNMNMAPVLDVPPPQGPSVMIQRAFGRDPQWVAEMGATVIEHLQANGIMAVGKHFPGIGRTVLDSHEDLPDLDIDGDTLAARDLVPFHAALETGVSGIMLSHIRYTGIDPQWPASLSVPVANDLLRLRMGYDGLVLTDDLDMGAIAKHYPIPVIVSQCLAAGVDILLICHSGPDIETAFDQIVQQTQADHDLQRMSTESVSRILATKERFLSLNG